MGVTALVALSLMPLVAVFVGAFTEARGPVMHWGKASLRSMERALSLEPAPIFNSLLFASTATGRGHRTGGAGELPDREEEVAPVAVARRGWWCH
jgi:hypothetical protein